jgi:hypothetical protein
MRGNTSISAQAGLHLSGFDTLQRLAVGDSRSPRQIQDWVIVQNAKVFDRWAESGRRVDSGFDTDGKVERNDSATDGFHLARQLEYIHSQVMEAPRPAYDGLQLFPISTEVPAGARSHTVRRVERTGDAAVYRAGMQIPVVGMSQVEEEFPVRHYVSSYTFDVFEQASSDYARSGIIRRKAATAADEITALMNRNTWHGDEANGLYGVLNYPWLAKRASVVDFTDAGNPDAMVKELHALANNPAEASKMIFAPDSLIVPPEVYHVISTKRLGEGVDGSSETVLSFFLKSSAYIKSVKASHELSFAGPGGTHAILVYKNDPMSVQNMMVQGVTALPVQERGLESFVYMYASHGGVVMRDVGNCALMYVNA